jgi:hypothetical protein
MVAFMMMGTTQASMLITPSIWQMSQHAFVVQSAFSVVPMDFFSLC